VRHGKERPPECRGTTSEMAAQKHMATEEAHEGFIRKLEHSLKTGQGISLPVRKPGPFSLESVI
jgi:hypothetical protein